MGLTIATWQAATGSRPAFIMLAAYMIGLFAMGIYFAPKQTSKDVYFLAGRRVGWFLAGISVLATLSSTVSYVSLPGEMIRYGVGFFTSQLAFLFIIPIVVGAGLVFWLKQRSASSAPALCARSRFQHRVPGSCSR